jgi:hypothetical protein
LVSFSVKIASWIAHAVGSVRDAAEMQDGPWPLGSGGVNKRQGAGVRGVILVAGAVGMVDLVAAAGDRLALKRSELTDETIIVDEPRPPGCEERQAIAVNRAAVAFGMLVFDAVRVEGIDNPTCRVPVADNRRDAVALQRRSNLRRRLGRAERGLDLDQVVEDGDLAVDAFSMTDRAAKRIGDRLTLSAHRRRDRPSTHYSTQRGPWPDPSPFLRR